MACCSRTPEEARSAAIDAELKVVKVQLRKEIKLLLLGAGESGKSTIVKQMKIIHGRGFTDEERIGFIPLIHQNIMTSMYNMLMAMPQLGIALADKSLQSTAMQFLEAHSSGVDRAPLDLVSSLWKDEGIQRVFARSREYQLSDSTDYYMSAIPRIQAQGYLPSEQDVLRARVPTTGVIEYTFILKKITFRMVDVGGQRSQRRKWIHCFEDVTSLIFIVALSEFDQTLIESPTTNRMAEAISLFRHITREKFFRHTSVILFLNKTDLLEKKIAKSNVKDYFSDYQGDPRDFKEVKTYFLSVFERIKDHLYPHFTCATDTSNIKFVFDSVEKMIIETHLRDFHIV
eukprot:m.285873 g.285873  ORF g.285873 m.285873 type:complete len:344 (-) comp11468_c0_seq1:1705-2736(-)